MTPLHHASSNGHLNVVHYLISQKVNINAKTNDYEILNIIGLLFIVLPIMVIKMLLST